MPMRSRTKPEFQLKIAKERIEILFDEAGKTSNTELARRYARLAKKIGMRYNIRLGPLKRKFCKYCCSYFTSGNSKRRLKGGVMSIHCLFCGKITRLPYKNQNKRKAF